MGTASNLAKHDGCIGAQLNQLREVIDGFGGVPQDTFPVGCRVVEKVLQWPDPSRQKRAL